ncbi:hypothetical protein GWK50_00705 [Acidovorax sp. 210-6]|uniref:hypothetical protein n=1 Tax=Acidovorax sp. 210-6 TaxID=2699468 RepID=UPI00138A0C09|nr:hypothetical protein [Acidovorax sp. 210-6]NCU64377.1 hypothetical protein [Acidovorax sp. 210-6]
MCPEFPQWFRLFSKKTWFGASLWVVIAVVLWSSEGPSINTGDWDRVTVPAGFLAPSWEPMQAQYSLGASAQITNNSSMGVLLSTMGWIIQRVGQTTLLTAPIFLALASAMAVGVFFLAHQKREPSGLLALSIFFLALLCYAVYLKSFYGEALVLALVPVLCVGIRQLVLENKALLFTLSAVVVLYAKQQMIFVAPVILILLLRNMWLHGAANPRLWASLFCIISVCAMLLRAHPENKAPNQYNRYFNGVGWSLLQSSNWPAQRFEERHPYFYQHQQQLKTLFPDALPHYNYLGTSYLPTASTLLDTARRSDSTDAQKTQAQDLFDQLVVQGRPDVYLLTLVQHPVILWRLVKNTYLTLVRSNYAVDYTRSGLRLAPAVAQVLINAQTLLARMFGWVFVVTLLMALVYRRSLFSAAIAVWMLLAPLAVVAGDGYFEFEKHMTAFFVFLPCAVMAVILRSPQASAASPSENGLPQG